MASSSGESFMVIHRLGFSYGFLYSFRYEDWERLRQLIQNSQLCLIKKSFWLIKDGNDDVGCLKCKLRRKISPSAHCTGLFLMEFCIFLQTSRYLVIPKIYFLFFFKLQSTGLWASYELWNLWHPDGCYICAGDAAQMNSVSQFQNLLNPRKSL